MSGHILEEEKEQPRTAAGPVPDRRNQEHILPSQGPLSSLKAVIKRRKSSSQNKLSGSHCRRRPEITIISSEHLDSGKVRPGRPQELSISRATPPQRVCPEAQEDTAAPPVAPPRRLNCTSSSLPSTAPSAAPGKTPPKPPRPSAPKNKKSVSAAQTNVNLTSKQECSNHHPESTVSIRSVTVFWNNSSTAASNCVQPVPLPRIKSKRPRVLSEESYQSHTLVQLCEDSDRSDCTVDTLSCNKYLQELLEVFNPENLFYQSSGDTENVNEMSLRARIQAFESQGENTAEPVKPQPKTRAKPPLAAKPPVATKAQYSTDDWYEEVCYSPPEPAPKAAQAPQGSASPSVKEELNAVLAQHRSKPPKLTRDRTIHDEEEFVTVSPKESLRPELNINNHNNYSTAPMYEKTEAEGPHDPMENEYDTPESTYDEPATQEPEDRESEYEFVEYAPSASKEPEYDSVDNTYEDKAAHHVPVKPEPSKSNYAGSRQSLTKRPTTIIVPSKVSDELQDSAPPLPVQRPVGTFRHSTATSPPQDSPSAAPEPTLPPRKLTTKKHLPPRPASMGPGRPPPPRADALHSTPQDTPPKARDTPPKARDTPPKPQPPKPAKRGPALPPRPNPGHRLYNKYTLQVPHAIAASDYNGSSTGELSFQKNEVLVLVHAIDANMFECQVGNRRGKVNRSSLKVITPLPTQHTPAQTGKASGSGGGLKVEALHDFSPENPGELALKAGDVVTLVEQVDSEWYKGTCRGSSGFFPINYVKVLTNSPQLPKTRAMTPSATVSGPRCVARFDFEGEHSDELSFSEGDTIQLKAYVGQDWARGQRGTFSGIFPLNFVEIIQDLPPQPSQATPPGPWKRASLCVSPSAQSQSEEWVVALYDFSGNAAGDLSFEKGDHIAVTKHINPEWSSGRLHGREGMFPRAFVESKTGGQARSRSRQSGAGAKAKALFDFTSHSEEELSMKAGDVITNLESVDDQWFLGDLKGKRALVPKNYVQVM